MTERCKSNPCCGNYLNCKEPPQFKPRESYEDYQRRIAPPASPSPAPAAETGWLIELKGTTPSWAIVNPNDYDEHWTTDSTRALRFARKVDAEAYIAHIGWTEAFASEHIWDDGRRSGYSDRSTEAWRDLDNARLQRAIDAFYEPCEGTTIDGIRNAILAWERG